jgi:hypothetical protein
MNGPAKSMWTLSQVALLWGIRVIVPAKLRSHIQDLLHEGHPGVVRMKAVARSCDMENFFGI